MFWISENGSLDRFRWAAGVWKSSGALRFIASGWTFVLRVKVRFESVEAAEWVFAECAADAIEDGAADWVIFDMSGT